MQKKPHILSMRPRLDLIFEIDRLNAAIVAARIDAQCNMHDSAMDKLIAEEKRHDIWRFKK